MNALLSTSPKGQIYFSKKVDQIWKGLRMAIFLYQTFTVSISQKNDQDGESQWRQAVRASLLDNLGSIHSI